MTVGVISDTHGLVRPEALTHVADRPLTIVATKSRGGGASPPRSLAKLCAPHTFRSGDSTGRARHLIVVRRTFGHDTACRQQLIKVLHKHNVVHRLILS
jgi:hypothetical protein